MAARRDGEYATFYAAQFRWVAQTVYLIVRERERAHDVTQDAFVQLYLHWPRVSQFDRPEAWVRRVAIRLAVRAVRRENLGLMLTLRQAEPYPENAAADVDLLQAVAALPARQRAAVVLFYYEDRPMAEVAELLDCSVPAAKATLHRARQDLARRLEERELDDVH